MLFPTLFRPPLVWLVIAEAVLLVVFGVMTWHVWLERTAPAAQASQAAAATQSPQPAGPASVATPPPAGVLPQSSPTPTSPRLGPTPGARTDAAFLSGQLAELNRVEAMLEDLEWRLTKAVVDGIQRYVEGVVLPSIERTEQRGGR